jgi:hypothetical protein
MSIDHSQTEHDNILKGLDSADPEKVLESIEELRVSGKTSDIPVLLEMLRVTKSPEIKSKIVSLLGNLKDRNSVPLMMEAIQNEKYAPVLQQLVSSCWENGLDYSQYISVFVDLLIDKDFLVAFEAYTVITNMEFTIDQAILDVEIEKLDKALLSTTSEKKVLLPDAIDFLPSIGY